MNLSWLANLKCRHIDLAGAAIIVAAALPLLLPRVNPLLRSGSLLEQQRAQLAIALRNEKDLNDFLVDQRGRLVEIQASLVKERIRLESARNINQRIAKLTSLAAGAGLNVNEILPGATVRGERFDSVPVRMNGTGSYPTCVAFLCKLTKTFPDTSVGSFELAGNPQKPGSPAEFHVDLIWHAAAEDAGGKR
jgi:Tfp pilus assembly protein PilO